ncbi:hypothetical protein [Ideonella sp. B508-1]|uniref:hypothetical protein n=1 Tax=Ideonella sp. B508-1 TaxID=137716 RepID=UPI00034D4191|nr:hypothetical protein [Ideonella sp. B508-1]
MTRILIAIITLAALGALGGCATKQELTMRNDPRVGTDFSPYRTIPAAIQCDDCRYEPAR